jgi:hypothetical protein
MDDDEATNYEKGASLKLIAGALGVPVDSFFATEQLRFSGQMGEAASRGEIAEALAVMRLFLRLPDPEARARCISFITQELLQNR